MTTADNIVVIEYNEKYASETVAMWRDSYENALGIKSIHSFENHSNFLRYTLLKENKVYLAIDRRNNTVVGMMATDGVELNQLYIHKDNQRQGIGSLLLNIAKEISKGKLMLYTFEVNVAAQAFYDLHGFKIIGRGYENEENLPDIKYEWNELEQTAT